MNKPPRPGLEFEKKSWKRFIPAAIGTAALAAIGWAVYQGYLTWRFMSDVFEWMKVYVGKYPEGIVGIMGFMVMALIFQWWKISASPFKAAALKANLRQKEIQLEHQLEQYREEHKEKMVRFSTLMLKLRDITSSLDKDVIFGAIMDILQKGMGAEEISIMMINSKGELFTVQALGRTFANEPVVKVGDRNFLGVAAKEGCFMSKMEAENNTVLSGFVGKSPIASVVCAPLIVASEVVGLINIGKLADESAFSKDDKILVTTCSQVAGLALKNSNILTMTQDELQSEKKFSAQQLEEKKKIKDMFGKYSSPAVVEQLIANPDKLRLGGEMVEATVFFSDIRSFTTYCENYTPEKVVQILNEYLSAMTDIIIENEGTLDKFVGDEIMALWGVPVRQDNHAKLAVVASWKMLIKLKELQEDWKKRGLQPLDIGMGINSGTMIVGNIGSEKQMDYTAIGDNVNIGARLEGLTRKFDSHLIISESTYELVKDIVEVKKLGAVQVKGKEKTVTIYSVVNVKI